MNIPNGFLDLLTTDKLMLARHPDGTWLVFKTLAEGFAEGNSPRMAYDNFKDGKMVILPETGKIAKVTPTVNERGHIVKGYDVEDGH